MYFYTYKKGTRSILPELIKNDVTDGGLVIDTAPRDHWSLYIMASDGERELLKVKAMCAQLCREN